MTTNLVYNKSTYEQFLDAINTTPKPSVFLYPIFEYSDTTSHDITSIIGLYCVLDTTPYYINILHSDIPSISNITSVVDILSHIISKCPFVYKLKELMVMNAISQYSGAIDLQFILRDNACELPVIQLPRVAIQTHTPVRYVHLTHLLEMYAKLHISSSSFTHLPHNSFVESTILPTLVWIENTPIHTIRGIYHSKCNLYTKTWRISNAIDGKFDILDKESGNRRSIIPSTPKGSIWVIDYDSFHLRLLSNLIRYNFSTSDIHRELATIYFDKSDITEEERNLAKNLTFTILYDDDVLDDPPEFFTRVYQLKDYLYKQFAIYNYIESPVNGWRMYPTERKQLLAYYIQSYETVIMMTLLDRLRTAFNTNNIRSRPMLYLYDSVVLDVHESDNPQLLHSIVREILTDNKTYVIKIHEGTNYHDLHHLATY